MKNKILAIMLATGMMTGMMAAPAAVSAADVNPLEQLVNEMSDQILPNPDAETVNTNNDSSVLADAGNKNDEIDPSFSQYDSILAPSSIINEWMQQQDAANLSLIHILFSYGLDIKKEFLTEEDNDLSLIHI